MFDLSHIWTKMSAANKGITLFILAMAVVSAAVTGERILALYRSAVASRRFAARADEAIRAWDPAALVTLAEQHRTSSLARLLGAVTTKYLDVSARTDDGSAALPMLRSESQRQQEIVGGELRRGMSILATVGSITPFVGLLGTVIGIIAAFQAIGAAGAGGLGTVSSAIGEALVETAFGLMVAIPAVIAFNYLSSRVNAVEASLGRSVGRLIDEMEFRFKAGIDQSRTSDVYERPEAA
ncbi:MAG: MotA/TolQ/ExbB proton channel family protein [Polyangiaceae bacterium]